MITTLYTTYAEEPRVRVSQQSEQFDITTKYSTFGCNQPAVKIHPTCVVIHINGSTFFEGRKYKDGGRR